MFNQGMLTNFLSRFNIFQRDDPEHDIVDASRPRKVKLPNFSPHSKVYKRNNSEDYKVKAYYGTTSPGIVGMLTHFLNRFIKIFQRSDSELSDYQVKAYQYGTTSHQTDTMKPAVIIYPGNVEDIQKAIGYASNKHVGIAVRTGGHQYSGACSTSGSNIQLDVGDTFKSEDDFHYDAEKNLAYVGVSFSLLEMNTKLRALGLFVPHGQCVHVHLGGHVQTGGYGQLSRAFGLLSDHVVGFKIVLADGKHVAIREPESDFQIPKSHKAAKTEKLNNDLYWAVLGGSPGNFGILTHVWIVPLKDIDYPDSRGMKLLSIYSKEKLEKVLDVIAEMNDDKDLPRDFDVCCSVFTNASEGYVLRSFIHPHLDHNAKFRNLDEEMQYEHAKHFGDGVDYAEDGHMATPEKPVPMLLIFMQWANTKGKEEKFADIPQSQRDWFKKIREASKPNIVDGTFDLLEETHLMPFAKWLKNLILDKRVDNWLHVNEENHTPISKLTRYWCYEDVREYLMSYEKRVYSSNKYDLRTAEHDSETWATWMTKRLDEVISRHDQNSAVISQIQPYGGKNSMFAKNGAENLQNGCHSWRQNITMGMTMDYFYQPEDEDPSKDSQLHRAVAWQKENDQSIAPGGIFSDHDRRVFWGSFSREDDPGNGGTDLDSVWDRYFDSKEKYERLINIKKEVDPKFIFTANTFSVGWKEAPVNRKIKPVKKRWDTTTV